MIYNKKLNIIKKRKICLKKKKRKLEPNGFCMFQEKKKRKENIEKYKSKTYFSTNIISLKYMSNRFVLTFRLSLIL